MRPLQVKLDQGVSLQVPPPELSPGELTFARNCHYPLNTHTLAKIAGRETFGTVNAGNVVNGTVFVQFRDGRKYLVCSSGQTYQAALINAGGSGTFVNKRNLAQFSGKMEGVYYNGTNRAYFMDGSNRPQVWDGGDSMRNMGLLTPGAPLVMTQLANAGTQYTKGTTFQYCYTEYDSVNGIESAPSPVDEIQISTTGNTIKLVPQYMFNCETIRYRIYRTQDGGGVFFRIADLDVGFTTYYDGQNTEGATSDRIDNITVWNFATVTDQFLQSQPVLPMLGKPLQGNYVTINGEPPKGDICVIFENSLVISGVKDFPQDVYYSQSDDPEMFSPIYFLREENARGDKVTGMGTANNRLIVFTENSIYRHDTLPRVTDPGYGLGAATRQLVTADHGCVAKRTVVNYGIGEDSNNTLFYLSSRGPFMTDGYNCTPLGSDLNWSSTLVNYATVTGAVAVNYPAEQQLWLFVPSPASVSNDMAFIYHYAPQHKKQETGMGKWTGPIDVRCESATVSPEVQAKPRLFLSDTNTSSKIYLHDRGFTDAQNYTDSSGNIVFEWITGDLDFGSVARQKRFERIFLTHFGTDSLSDAAVLFFAGLSQASDEWRLALTETTSNVEQQMTFGTTGIVRAVSRVTQAGLWQAGTHLRLHFKETASVPRGIVNVEVEVGEMGKVK